ncbi:hypothetical protein PPL_07730 [Heterostelium album PN500]|uniref:Large ribosomal subunit protein eL19 domain-containing protein n=1 Tax=Heterostelium pallidum (strain ATCC 26659 / Pp 5 / PN500) TaxID=670386 RepID=D3BGS8_HETP5|nr:hypothetical protein PPL_07730 [Heterostelium album PN500]EFA79312.1 hypothetical protein PPL_07730 [Heterostelium album PN500]|eukprot:XP_020431433.1 hypothetical protein PPL_07730 [Heterostelium album PN500]
MVYSPKELAMRILKVGARKVWLDPTKMEAIQQTKTREGIRELIAQGAIKRKFTLRGSYKSAKGPFLFPKEDLTLIKQPSEPLSQ